MTPSREQYVRPLDASQLQRNAQHFLEIMREQGFPNFHPVAINDGSKNNGRKGIFRRSYPIYREELAVMDDRYYQGRLRGYYHGIASTGEFLRVIVPWSKPTIFTDYPGSLTTNVDTYVRLMQQLMWRYKVPSIA